MTDRTELLETALDSLPDGIALLGGEGQVLFWNRAAEAITGHARVDLLAHQVPDALKLLLPCCARNGDQEPGDAPQSKRGALVRARHKLDHDLQLITRTRA
jgi:PAS domain-containing protein